VVPAAVARDQGRADADDATADQGGEGEVQLGTDRRGSISKHSSTRRNGGEEGEQMTPSLYWAQCVVMGAAKCVFHCSPYEKARFPFTTSALGAGRELFSGDGRPFHRLRSICGRAPTRTGEGRQYGGRLKTSPQSSTPFSQLPPADSSFPHPVGGRFGTQRAGGVATEHRQDGGHAHLLRVPLHQVRHHGHPTPLLGKRGLIRTRLCYSSL